MGPRPKAEILDVNGEVRYYVTGKMLGIPKQMKIADAAGAEVASLKAKMFSPIKKHMTMEVPCGEDWTLEGSFIEKNYAISSGGNPVAAITQKWVTVRDTYTLDVVEGTDPALALAILWAVDRWVERD